MSETRRAKITRGLLHLQQLQLPVFRIEEVVFSAVGPSDTTVAVEAVLVILPTPRHGPSFDVRVVQHVPGPPHIDRCCAGTRNSSTNVHFRSLIETRMRLRLEGTIREGKDGLKDRLMAYFKYVPWVWELINE